MGKNLSSKDAPKNLNTRQATQTEENQERCREQIEKETESSTYVAAQQENKWEKLKEIIKYATETHVGYKKKVKIHQISHSVLERMSKEQKVIRLKLQRPKYSKRWIRKLEMPDKNEQKTS